MGVVVVDEVSQDPGVDLGPLPVVHVVHLGVVVVVCE